MEDFFGSLLIKAIPFIIPFVLFCSWVMNWKSDGPKKGGEDAPPKEKKPKPEKKDSAPPPDTEE